MSVVPLLVQLAQKNDIRDQFIEVSPQQREILVGAIIISLWPLAWFPNEYNLLVQAPVAVNVSLVAEWLPMHTACRVPANQHSYCRRSWAILSTDKCVRCGGIRNDNVVKSPPNTMELKIGNAPRTRACNLGSRATD